MAEDEELKPPPHGAVVDPALRGGAAGSQSKRAARKMLLPRSRASGTTSQTFPECTCSGGRSVVALGANQRSNGAVSTQTRTQSVHTTRSRVYLTGANLCMAAGEQEVEIPVADLVNVATNAQSCASVALTSMAELAPSDSAGQRELQFPVRGIGGRALMSAIDESGIASSSIDRFRLKRGAFRYHSTSDAAIDPNTLTTPQIEFVVAVSAMFLLSCIFKGWWRVIALALCHPDSGRY